MKKNIVSGEYNQYGYTIWLNHTVVYTAGNHRHDSSQSATNESDRLSVRQIRLMCMKTAKEIATERKGVYAGVEHVADTSE